MTPTPETLAALVARVCTTHHWRRQADGRMPHVRRALTEADLRHHLNGGPAVGACPIAPGTDTTRCAVLDFDSHKGETPWPAMQDVVRRVMAALSERGLHANPFRSTGGAGVHLVMLWAEDQLAAAVRAVLREALAACGLRVGTKGVAAGEVEVFPKQDAVGADNWGSMFVLPLAGKSVALGWDTLELVDDWQWRGSEAVPAVEVVAGGVGAMPQGVGAMPQGVGAVAEVDAQDISRLRAALAVLPNDDLDYDQWRNVIFAIHHKTGGSDEGLALAHEFSARSSKYDADFLEKRVWPYIRQDREPVVTGAYLYGRAAAAGWVDPAALDGFEVLPEGGTAESAGVGEGGKPLKWPVQFADAIMEGKRPGWLVRGVLPAAGVGMVFGASGSGKTFFVLDLAAAVARGVEWRGRRVKGGRVVYVCAEGLGGFRDRLRAYQQVHGAGALAGLGVIAGAPNFMQADEIREVVASVRAFGGAVLVVVDTLAQVTPGANENAGEDMGKAVHHCQTIQKYTGTTVLLVHHSGKDESRGARGWSGIRGAMDVEIEVARGRDARGAQITKLKDGGEEGEIFGFNLQPVPVGVDEDGETVTSCTVVQCDIKQHKPLRSLEQAIMDAVDAAGGSTTIEDVRKAMLDGDKNRHVRRALKGLADKGFVTIEGEDVKAV